MTGNELVWVPEGEWRERAGRYTVTLRDGGWEADKGDQHLERFGKRSEAKDCCQNDYDDWMTFHRELNRRLNADLDSRS
jgi:hypothetical protein